MNRFVAAAVLVAIAAAAGPPAGTRAAFAAGPNPTVVSVDPATASAAGGVPVTVTGTDFVDPMMVTFGGTPATMVTVTSPTTLTCVVPAHPPGAVDVVATQTTPPISTSAPLVAGFTYTPPPAFVWIPRAPGSATGGNPGGLDVTVVDFVNRTVAGSVDLNAADAELPSDDAWRVSQILFDGTGAHAFLATQGTLGSFNSRKIFIVRTARVLGTEVGAPILATIDTTGNPYQIALSGTGNTLYVADGGSWNTSPIPGNGKFRVYDVTDRSAPVQQGTGTDVGLLPVLSYDRSAYGGWNTNSSFSGLIQSKGSRSIVTNAGSHTLSVMNLLTRAVTATVDVGVPGGGAIQVSTSIPSPYSDDIVFVQTIDATSQASRYWVHRISTDTPTDKGPVTTPIQFFSAVPALDLAGRGAWAHPDDQSLVAIPSTDPSVATWSPATGSASNRTPIAGGGPPTTLAYNDAQDFFYAREADGGWTVFTVASARSAPPVAVKSVVDATGVDSLRVVGDGSVLVGTATSALVVVDGVGTSPTAHEIVGTVPLPLDPRGGASFPQPGGGGSPRTFVTVAGPTAGPRIVLPLSGDEFGPEDDPPTFEIDDAGVATRELELGTQPDFIALPGARRVRIPLEEDALSIVPPAGAWRRILTAAAGGVSRPVYARVNRVGLTGFRTYGDAVTLRVAAPRVPTQVAPADGAAATTVVPPSFLFDTAGPGTYWLEFAGPGGFDDALVGRVFAARDPAGAQLLVIPSAGAWRRIAERAVRRSEAGGDPAEVLWRVRFRDAFRRVVFSDERSIDLD